MVSSTLDLRVLRILHFLNVAGWSTEERVIDWANVLPADARTVLGGEDFRSVSSPNGTLWSLSDAGKASAAKGLEAMLTTASLDGRSALDSILAEFETHDPTLKKLVTLYQRDRTAFNARSVSEFHDEVLEVLNRVGEAFPLWSNYPLRLSAAARRIDDGDGDYVASPLLDSYHTVWHVLHRDMRLVLLD